MPTLFNKEVKFPLGGKKGMTFTIVSMQAYTTVNNQDVVQYVEKVIKKTQSVI